MRQLLALMPILDHEMVTQNSPALLALGMGAPKDRPERTSNPADAGCNSDNAQYSKTPSLRSPEFEDSLAEVAFCSLDLQFCPERSRENEAPHEAYLCRNSSSA